MLPAQRQTPPGTRSLWVWWCVVAVVGALLLAWFLSSKPHLPLRVLRADGEWFLERCESSKGKESFRCVADVDFETELDIDEDGDGVAELRTFLWDGSKPRACETRVDGRWQPLSLAACCCRAGCSDWGKRAVGSSCR